jgi:hypothetical protein
MGTSIERLTWKAENQDDAAEQADMNAVSYAAEAAREPDPVFARELRGRATIARLHAAHHRRIAALYRRLAAGEDVGAEGV